MSAPKTERLLNLLIMLLVQRHYVSKDRIRSILYDGASDDAFEKMFERDKEELRSLGVPIEVGQMDAYFDDEPGSRIRADEFALPEISLESDEAAVVGLAMPAMAAGDAVGVRTVDTTAFPAVKFTAQVPATEPVSPSTISPRTSRCRGVSS